MEKKFDWCSQNVNSVSTHQREKFRFHEISMRFFLVLMEKLNIYELVSQSI